MISNNIKLIEFLKNLRVQKKNYVNNVDLFLL